MQSGDIITNQLVQFKNNLVNDLRTTGNLINNTLKQQLEPLASGLQSMYTNLFDGFLTNMNKQQQEQDSGFYKV